jgi:hypothetical protein
MWLSADITLSDMSGSFVEWTTASEGEGSSSLVRTQEAIGKLLVPSPTLARTEKSGIVFWHGQIDQKLPVWLARDRRHVVADGPNR